MMASTVMLKPYGLFVEHNVTAITKSTIVAPNCETSIRGSGVGLRSDLVVGCRENFPMRYPPRSAGGIICSFSDIREGCYDASQCDRGSGSRLRIPAEGSTGRVQSNQGRHSRNHAPRVAYRRA